MAGEAVHCFHFKLHNFYFILAAQRPAVGFIDWLDAPCYHFLVRVSCASEGTPRASSRFST